MTESFYQTRLYPGMIYNIQFDYDMFEYHEDLAEKCLNMCSSPIVIEFDSPSTAHYKWHVQVSTIEDRAALLLAGGQNCLNSSSGFSFDTGYQTEPIQSGSFIDLMHAIAGNSIVYLSTAKENLQFQLSDQILFTPILISNIEDFSDRIDVIFPNGRKRSKH